MNKSDAKYAASSADLVAQFVQDANDEMIGEFCSRFEILIGKQHRAKAEKMARKLSEEFLNTKEAQKSGNSSVNKDSPSTAVDVSVFGTKSGTKQYVVDEMLAAGMYALDEIVSESGASMETVKRRIRKLKSDGYEAAVSEDGKIGIYAADSFPAEPPAPTEPLPEPTTQKEEQSSGKKRKRKRKK